MSIHFWPWPIHILLQWSLIYALNIKFTEPKSWYPLRPIVLSIVIFYSGVHLMFICYSLCTENVVEDCLLKLHKKYISYLFNTVEYLHYSKLTLEYLHYSKLTSMWINWLPLCHWFFSIAVSIPRYNKIETIVYAILYAALMSYKEWWHIIAVKKWETKQDAYKLVP